MKFKNRANINARFDLLLFVIIALFIVLFIRMGYLTLIDGSSNRERADQRRLRTIHESAPRGEIRDVHGRLLAGNIPSFTVQISKDELLNNEIKPEDRNDVLLKLIRFLEEDGSFYQGEFPMDLNIYVYSSPDLYLSREETPSEYMISQLEDEEVLRSFINGKMNLDRYIDHYKFSVKERALNAVRDKYVDIPVEIVEGEFYAEEARLSNFLIDKKMDPSLDAESLVFNIIKSDRTIARKILNHPIARAILFQIVADKGNIGDIRMQSVAIKSDIEGLENRVNLAKNYDNISMQSTAEEIFLTLGNQFALPELLKKSYREGELIPGEILLKELQKKGKLNNMEIYLSEDKTSVFYRYTNMVSDRDPMRDLMASMTPEEIKDFLLREEIRPLVQRELLNLGINPRISIAGDDGIVFSSELNKNRLYGRFYKKDFKGKEYPPVEELFEKAKEYYKIDSELSNYEAKAILNIYELSYLVGESAYKPINLTYGLKDETVAKIEENIPDNYGIRVSIEPVRYYPGGQNSSHILGYMGKISTDNEIGKYVKEAGYDKNEFIGKTGVEEYFEEYLHGTNGEKKIEVDYQGNTTANISETKSIPGDTLYLTIDAKLQSLAEQYMAKTLELTRTGGVWESPWGNYKMDGTLDKSRNFVNANAGAVVVLKAKTGEVVASASYPGYDPNLFSTGITDTDWKALHPENEEDPMAARPLLNIATGTAIQPGSTFKMITGFAALQNGLDPMEKIYDGGYVKIGDTQFNCLIYSMRGGSHGNVDLAHALEHSCNYYFYTLALGKNQRQNDKPISAHIDIDDIREAGKEFGLNAPTGIEINIPREAVGEVPEPEKKIMTIKFYIKQFLNENIRDFFARPKEDDEIKKDIDLIASWAEEGRSLSKNEIISRLEEMGYIADKKVDGQKISLSDRLKYDYINQAEWSLADTINVTIGQGASSLTPMQMANYVATIANGGTRNKVTLLNSIKSYDGLKDVLNPSPNPVKIDIKNHAGFEQLKYGMGLVSSVGTSRRVFQEFPIATGSKTGTAEREGVNPATGKEYDDFAWYVAFAPYDDPEVVVAALLFQGGTGSNAGPMARDLMAEYLGLNRHEIKDSMPFTNRIME